MASTTREYLDVLARLRGDALVVAAMQGAKVWSLVSDSLLDVNHLPSAMGHASDIALGLALAQPARQVICINGDGSLLMNLGTLVTAAAARASNLTMLVLENGTYALGGGGPVPGTGLVDFAVVAQGCGWPTTVRCADAGALAARWPEITAGQGPTLVALAVADPVELASRLPRHHPRDALRALRIAFARQAGPA
jgi:phosphonopyruvate decarboxylase